MPNRDNSSSEIRIRENAHFARLLRQRLESRHGNGALREMLARLSDQELIDSYLANEARGREHAAKRRAEKESE
jgi:hypothetical protein